jgi:hypothetical protein
MTQSDSIKNLATALCKFQSEIVAIKKDAKNPFFKSSYASLGQIISSIREPLAKNGLSITQFPSQDGTLTTTLMHDSGEWISATTSVYAAKNDPQSLGSAITYMRRYALGAALNLAIDTDDDGNAASGKTTTPAKPTSYSYSYSTK